MKKLFVAVALSAAFALTAFAGCASSDQEKEHAFVNYIVMQPTCEEEGLMERVCSLCGHKEYLDIAATGHKWEDGVCTVCGALRTPEEPSQDPVATDFMTLSDVYERVCTFGFKYTLEKFLWDVNNTVFSDLYINANGRLKGSADGIFADVGDVRRNIPFSGTARVGTIIRAEIEMGSLIVTDRTGKTAELGVIAELVFNSNSAQIVGFVVNLQNELLLLYRNGEVVKAGCFTTKRYEQSEDFMMYLEQWNGYAVYGPLDRNLESVTVAGTHMGKPVVAVADGAFSSCEKLRFVELPEGIESIEPEAFRNCAALESIVLPASLRRIDAAVFSLCSSLKTIFFRGTQEEWRACKKNAINNNELAQADVYFYSENAPAVAGNTWYYLNGVPTIRQ